MEMKLHPNAEWEKNVLSVEFWIIELNIICKTFKDFFNSNKV